MRDILVFIIVFGLLPFVLFRAWLGVLLWNWIGLMNPHRLGWGFAYQFPFAYFTAATTLVGFLFSKERRAIPSNPVVWFLIAFIVWMNITTYFALIPDEAFIQWKKVMKIQLFILITLSVMQSKLRIMQLLWVTVFSIGFFGVKGGFFTLIHNGAFLVLGPRGSWIEDNNTLALSLIMVLPLMWYLKDRLKDLWQRVLMVGAMGLVMVSIFGSHSRGALLAFCAMLIILFFKSKQKFRWVALMVLVIPVALSSLPENWFTRMKTIQTYEQDASAMGRVNAWKFAINLTKDRPILGGGFEAFRPSLFAYYAPNPNDYHDSHSIYFEILGEHGYVGLMLYLGLLGSAWRLAYTVKKRTQSVPSLQWAHDLALMIQASIMGYLIGGAFLGIAYFDLYYSLIGMIVLLDQVVRQELSIVVHQPEEIRMHGAAPF